MKRIDYTLLNKILGEQEELPKHQKIRPKKKTVPIYKKEKE
jgi:hypothetical protein